MKIPHPVAPAMALMAALALTACGGPAETNDGAPGSNTATPSSTAPTPASSDATSTAPVEPTGPGFAVTIKGSKVGPNAQGVSAAPGEAITIAFDADRAGQLHVHSKPEQFVDFPAGTSSKELVIRTPGTVEIEEHDSEAVVAVVTVK
ncbi:hypothetical protein [Nocardioides sp. Root190]|uniref:hypothetical protein n=1 Tax=Nocardioides sp. Root190 TaxID=1736488 RepID=UPI000A9D2974|nr:hypothetical protein [Nocardioides sp. Root190]